MVFNCNCGCKIGDSRKLMQFIDRKVIKCGACCADNDKFNIIFHNEKAYSITATKPKIRVHSRQKMGAFM